QPPRGTGAVASAGDRRPGQCALLALDGAAGGGRPAALLSSAVRFDAGPAGPVAVVPALLHGDRPPPRRLRVVRGGQDPRAPPGCPDLRPGRVDKRPHAETPGGRSGRLLGAALGEGKSTDVRLRRSAAALPGRACRPNNYRGPR